MARIRNLRFAASMMFCAALALSTHFAQAQTEPTPLRNPDVLWMPTPPQTVELMLQIANVSKDDVLYDLGCGDGRIVIEAAKRYGMRAVGIDIDPQRIAEANANAKAAGVAHLVEFRLADLFGSEISEATVVTLFLTTRLNQVLRPKLLKELKKGTRILSVESDMGDWEPAVTSKGGIATVHMWTIP